MAEPIKMRHIFCPAGLVEKHEAQTDRGSFLDLARVFLACLIDGEMIRNMGRRLAGISLAGFAACLLYSGCTVVANEDCYSYDSVCDPVSSFWFVNIPNYRLIFVSSTTTDGFFGGISGADAICQSDAGTLGLSGTFKALVAAAMSPFEPRR